MKARTNIEIDMTLVEYIRRRYRLRTKTEVVDYALHALAGQPMTRVEAIAMHGANAIGDIPQEHPTPDFE